jgi:hypothetical protein
VRFELSPPKRLGAPARGGERLCEPAGPFRAQPTWVTDMCVRPIRDLGPMGVGRQPPGSLFHWRTRGLLRTSAGRAVYITHQCQLGAMLVDGVRPQPTGDPLRRAARLDGPLALPRG